MVHTTQTRVRPDAADPEQFTPGPGVLVHLAAHLWRSKVWVRVTSLALLVGGAAKLAGLG